VLVRRWRCPGAPQNQPASIWVPESLPCVADLGGPDRRTLFILTAEWRLADGAVKNLDRLADGPRTGEILALPVEVPRAGRP